MNGIVIGVAMLVSSSGASPAPETSLATVVPAAFSYDLPVEAGTPRNVPSRLVNDQTRPVWQRGSRQSSQPAKRFNRMDKIIAIVGGTCVGWVVGGGIGFAATAERDNDVAGFRGLLIGAPVGAVAGAMLGYRLTK